MHQKSKDVHRKVMIAMIAHGMNWDESKATLWMETKNPMLGNVTPDTMINVDRVSKLYDFIENSLKENKPVISNRIKDENLKWGDGLED